jgi:hypothetical protein
MKEKEFCRNRFVPDLENESLSAFIKKPEVRKILLIFWRRQSEIWRLHFARLISAMAFIAKAPVHLVSKVTWLVIYEDKIPIREACPGSFSVFYTLELTQLPVHSALVRRKIMNHFTLSQTDYDKMWLNEQIKAYRL